MNQEEFLELKRIYAESTRFGTHWEDCWKSHVWCAIVKLIKGYEMKKETDRSVTMTRKPNRQIKLQFFRNQDGNWDKVTGKYVLQNSFTWAVRIDIADHSNGYTFLDQNNHSIKFPSLKSAKEYADGIIKEVAEFLDKDGE